MKVTRIKKLMISGLSTTTNNELEMSEENGKIPTLWNDYFQKDIYKKLLIKQTKIICMVYIVIMKVM